SIADCVATSRPPALSLPGEPADEAATRGVLGKHEDRCRQHQRDQDCDEPEVFVPAGPRATKRTGGRGPFTPAARGMCGAWSAFGACLIRCRAASSSRKTYLASLRSSGWCGSGGCVGRGTSTCSRCVHLSKYLVGSTAPL